MTPVEKRRAIYHQKQLAEARAIDECLTVIRRRLTRKRMAQQPVTSIAETRRAWLDWRDRCPIVRAAAKKGLTQAMLSALVGVTPWTVSRWAGGARASAIHVAKIEAVLGIDDLTLKIREWRKEMPR